MDCHGCGRVDAELARLVGWTGVEGAYLLSGAKDHAVDGALEREHQSGKAGEHERRMLYVVVAVLKTVQNKGDEPHQEIHERVDEQKSQLTADVLVRLSKVFVPDQARPDVAQFPARSTLRDLKRFPRRDPAFLKRIHDPDHALGVTRAVGGRVGYGPWETLTLLHREV